MSKLDWLTQEIDGLKEQGLYNRIRTIGSAQGARIVVDGKDVLNFCSNNYLGLANHPKIVEAAKDATKKYGVGHVTTDLAETLKRLPDAGDRREVAGQLMLIALVPMGHLVGRLPVGNTGGSNVSAFKPMAIPPDLERLIEDRDR